MRFESHQEKLYALQQNSADAIPNPPEKGSQQAANPVPLFSSIQPASAAASVFVTPPLAIVVLNRMGFGPRPGDVDAFNAMGATDTERITSYVDQQLDPDSIDDSTLQSRLNIPGYQTLNKTLTQLWTDHQLSEEWQVRIRPVQETAYSAYVRATYSERQLVEVLADFWHDHFNVYGYDDPANSVWVSYDRDVIRPHLLGNFRQMLEATAKSTAMLAYLDNAVSSAENPNENYAREILELHTLGAPNYFGAIDPESVPKDSNGIAVGFVEADVKEMARCLTGWSHVFQWETPSTGNFIYRSSYHDTAAKQVLGKSIPADQAELKDARDILDLLAAHPATAKFICTKLCRRLVADNPPQSLIDSAASLFSSLWQAPDQLKQVTRHILISDEFRNTWGEKVKRPFETIVSSMRALRFDYTMSVEVGSYNSTLEYHFQRTGHFPFTWAPPNGFPDKQPAWLGTSALAMTWRAQNHLLHGEYWKADKNLHTPVLEDTLAEFPAPSSRTPNNLAGFWFNRILGYQPDAQQIARIATVLGHAEPNENSQDLDQPINIESDIWPSYWQSGLRTMVGTILISPEFLRR